MVPVSATDFSPRRKPARPLGDNLVITIFAKPLKLFGLLTLSTMVLVSCADEMSNQRANFKQAPEDESQNIDTDDALGQYAPEGDTSEFIVDDDHIVKSPGPDTQPEADDQPAGDDSDTAPDSDPSQDMDTTPMDDPVDDTQDADADDDQQDADDTPADDPSQTPVDPVPEEVVIMNPIGLRNFDQTNLALAALTGISEANQNVRDEFLKQKSQLPTSNAIDEVTPAKINAVTKLAATYCDELVNDQQVRNQVFPTIDFTQSPAQAFADLDAVAKEILEKLWGKDLDNLADQAGDITIVGTLITEMTQNKPTTPATTRNVIMGTCTAVLASAPVLLF